MDVEVGEVDVLGAQPRAVLLFDRHLVEGVVVRHALLGAARGEQRVVEAEVVLLYDLGGISRGFSKQDLYVAISRAKVHLIAITHGSECRALIEAALRKSQEEA